MTRTFLQEGEGEDVPPPTHTEAQEIAARYNNTYWALQGLHDRQEDLARYSIPVNPRYDDDVRLRAYIQHQQAVQDALGLLLAGLSDRRDLGLGRRIVLLVAHLNDLVQAAPDALTEKRQQDLSAKITTVLEALEEDAT